MGILPNARGAERVVPVNLLLSPLADGKSVYFLDLGSKFVPLADNWKGLSRDKLHLTAEGYEMWAQELNTLLGTLAQADQLRSPAALK